MARSRYIERLSYVKVCLRFSVGGCGSKGAKNGRLGVCDQSVGF